MTARPVIPRRQADNDIRAALDHYLVEAGAEVALRFIDDLDKAMQAIGRNPAAGSPRYANELDLSGLRHWPMKRFPYLIFYVERGDDIDVWRVLHARRDIPTWMSAPE